MSGIKGLPKNKVGTVRVDTPRSQPIPPPQHQIRKGADEQIRDWLRKNNKNKPNNMAHGGVAGRNLDALKNKLLGKSANPVAALLAQFEGKSDIDAAALLAEVLINSGVEVA